MQRLFVSIVLAVLCLVCSATAQISAPQFGSGSGAFDGWVSMYGASYPGISGSFPGASVWTATAGSNQAGSGDAELNKMSGAAFFASDSLYLGSFTQVPNALGASFRVSDQTPLAGVRTIILQIQIGEAVGYDFVSPAGAPVLKLNGSNSSSISPNFTTLMNRYQDGTYFSPQTELDEPVYVNTYAFEWNLGANPVTSIAIDFSAVTHAQVYAMRLDQSTAVLSQSVFSPAAPSAPPVLNLLSVGQPSHNGAVTTVVHGFSGDPGSVYAIEFKEVIDAPAWTSAGTYSTGNGTFSVSFNAAGDRRAAWSQKMFFRATRQ